jgi:hypothetical protein
VLLFEVGGVIAKGAAPKVLAATAKLVRTVVILLTVNNAVVDADKKFELLSWFAVMVVLPTPTIVTMLPSTVATSSSELV